MHKRCKMAVKNKGCIHTHKTTSINKCIVLLFVLHHTCEFCRLKVVISTENVNSNSENSLLHFNSLHLSLSVMIVV